MVINHDANGINRNHIIYRFIRIYFISVRLRKGNTAVQQKRCQQQKDKQNTFFHNLPLTLKPILHIRKRKFGDLGFFLGEKLEFIFFYLVNACKLQQTHPKLHATSRRFSIVFIFLIHILHRHFIKIVSIIKIGIFIESLAVYHKKQPFHGLFLLRFFSQCRPQCYSFRHLLNARYIHFPDFLNIYLFQH